jgi:hypothetical protein
MDEATQAKDPQSTESEGRSDTSEKESGETHSSAEAKPSPRCPLHQKQPERNPPSDEIRIPQEHNQGFDRTTIARQSLDQLNLINAALNSSLHPLVVERLRSTLAAGNNPRNISSISETETSENERRQRGNDNGDTDSTEESRTSLHQQQLNQLGHVTASLPAGLLAAHVVRQIEAPRDESQNQVNYLSSALNSDINSLLAERPLAELTAVNPPHPRNLRNGILDAAILNALMRQGSPLLSSTSGVAAGMLGLQRQMPGFSCIDQSARISALLLQQTQLQRLSSQQQFQLQQLSSLAGIQQLQSAALLSRHPDQRVAPQTRPISQDPRPDMPGGISCNISRASLPAHAGNAAVLSSSVESNSSQNESHESSSDHVDFALTGRPAIALATDSDSANLSPYQCFLREQIELFETVEEDISAKAQGRNIPIRVGQVGIRCRHCASLPRSKKAEGGAVFYSKTINGIYQVSLNMGRIHLLSSCTMIPENVKRCLAELKKLPRRLVKGRLFWRDALEAQGVIDEGDFLKFKPP